MCKRLFRALKIKMDNYHLRYALAGAEEKIEVLEQQLKEKSKENTDLNLALNLMRKYMFNVMCADDVPPIEYFIECAQKGEDNA